jgi:hypothetical protein
MIFSASNTKTNENLNEKKMEKDKLKKKDKLCEANPTKKLANFKNKLSKNSSSFTIPKTNIPPSPFKFTSFEKSTTNIKEILNKKNNIQLSTKFIVSPKRNKNNSLFKIPEKKIITNSFEPKKIMANSSISFFGRGLNSKLTTCGPIYEKSASIDKTEKKNNLVFKPSTLPEFESYTPPSIKSFFFGNIDQKKFSNKLTPLKTLTESKDEKVSNKVKENTSVFDNLLKANNKNNKTKGNSFFFN